MIPVMFFSFLLSFGFWEIAKWCMELERRIEKLEKK